MLNRIEVRRIGWPLHQTVLFFLQPRNQFLPLMNSCSILHKDDFWMTIQNLWQDFFECTLQNNSACNSPSLTFWITLQICKTHHCLTTKASPKHNFNILLDISTRFKTILIPFFLWGSKYPHLSLARLSLYQALITPEYFLPVFL